MGAHHVHLVADLGLLECLLRLRHLLQPLALLAALKELEVRIGRLPTRPMGPRIVDLATQA